MPEQTPRAGLNTWGTDETGWTYTDTVEFVDETHIQTGPTADRPASGTYDNELYLDFEAEVLFRWDATTNEWEVTAFGPGATPTWTGVHTFMSGLNVNDIRSAGDGEGLTLRTEDSTGYQTVRLQISDGIDGSYIDWEENERFSIRGTDRVQFFLRPSDGGENRIRFNDSFDDDNWWIRTNDDGEFIFNNRTTLNNPLVINDDDSITTSSHLSVGGDVTVDGGRVFHRNSPLTWIGALDSNDDVRIRAGGGSVAAEFTAEDNVDIPNGELSEQGDRVATRPWTTANFSNTEPTDVTSLNWGDRDLVKNGADAVGVINFKT